MVKSHEHDQDPLLIKGILNYCKIAKVLNVKLFNEFIFIEHVQSNNVRK